MASGYADPPEHRPNRCERTTTIKKRDEDGKISEVPYPYRRLVAVGFDRYLDSKPTRSAPPSDWLILDPAKDFGSPVIVGGTSHHMYQLWGSICRDPETGADDPYSAKLAWVKIVSAENLIDDLLVEVTASMSTVAQTWPTVSPTHGWQMVKVPLEIRGTPPEPISRTASASNLTGSLSISITATPSFVAFDGGDGEPPLVCPIAALAWPVPPPDQPSPCSYTYQHSSVQRGGAPFATRLLTVWILKTPDPAYNGAWPLPSVTTDLLVAEAQALVTG